MAFSITRSIFNIYCYILYHLFRFGFYIGLYANLKQESFLHTDYNYIHPLKTKFLKTFENLSINFNENIESIFYDKKEFSSCVIESENHLEKDWRTRIMFETTPRGNIIMFYDAYKLGFSFFCDQKVISYDILNAAAMKYVSLFRCRDFFIDETITPTSSPFIKLHLTDEPKKELSKSDKSAFVKLQNYSKDLHPNKKGSTHSAVSLEKMQPNKTGINEPEKMKNKFLYLGKIHNFKMTQFVPKYKVLAKFSSPLLENIKLDSNVQRQQMSYSDFKKSIYKKVDPVSEPS